MNKLMLREYQPYDWKLMYSLDLQCFARPFRFSRSAMRRFAESDGAITVLAEAEGKLAGFCIVQMEERTGYVVTLDVAAEWRRNGLATQLIAEVKARARRAGAETMALHVFTGNSGAIRFYEALGYRRIEVAEGFYGRGLDAFVYVAELGRPDSYS